MAQFTQEQINAAVAEFTANAQARTLAGAGHNKDITIYSEVQNVTIQTPVGKRAGAEEAGPDGG